MCPYSEFILVHKLFSVFSVVSECTYEYLSILGRSPEFVSRTTLSSIVVLNIFASPTMFRLSQIVVSQRHRLFASGHGLSFS